MDSKEVVCILIKHKGDCTNELNTSDCRMYCPLLNFCIDQTNLHHNYSIINKLLFQRALEVRTYFGITDTELFELLL